MEKMNRPTDVYEKKGPTFFYDNKEIIYAVSMCCA